MATTMQIQSDLDTIIINRQEREPVGISIHSKDITLFMEKHQDRKMVTHT